MKKFDNYLVGPLTFDYDQFRDNRPNPLLGGPTLYSGYACLAGGRQIGAVATIAPEDAYITQPFYMRDLTLLPTEHTTSVLVHYESEDKEQRTMTVRGMSRTMTPDDVPAVDAQVYQMMGIFRGQLDDALFAELSARGRLACDLQGYLRCADGDAVVFRDWPEKKQYLPYVTYLKADAAEAAVITGTQDRAEAARILHAWGASEVLITHNSEVLVYDGARIYTCPLRPRNLFGRTGRGDTTFASYITERADHSVADALLYASALVSLKMETFGPFKGTRGDVEAYMRAFYPDYCAL